MDVFDNMQLGVGYSYLNAHGVSLLSDASEYEGSTVYEASFMQFIAVKRAGTEDFVAYDTNVAQLVNVDPPICLVPDDSGTPEDERAECGAVFRYDGCCDTTPEYADFSVTPAAHYGVVVPGYTDRILLSDLDLTDME